MKKVVVIFLIMGVFLLNACSDLTIKLPTFDNTPPTLLWNVYNKDTKEGKDYLGSPTIKVASGDKYRITLKAIDADGGVKSITSGDGWVNWTCKSPGPENAESQASETWDETIQNFTPDGNGMVLTSFVIMRDVDFTLSCQDSWSFNEGGGQLKGQATNYYGGVANELIMFQVSK